MEAEQKANNSLAVCRPDLVLQWDWEKNADLDPTRITPGSQKSVWWRCEKGHSWRAMVKSRSAGGGCPYCAGRKVLAGYNSLEDLFPELAKEWDHERNAPLTPTQVSGGSTRKVWWRCGVCGYGWQAAVATRASHGCGCPRCAGKVVAPGVNDLASRFPRLAQQWDRERNGALSPERVSPYSNRRVWWRCRRGHSYRAAVADRAERSTGCPYCTGRKVLAGFNDLATCYPLIARDWHPTLNGNLSPQMVAAGSRSKVWWQCPFGHVWRTAVFSRTGPQKCGCPVCAGRTTEKWRRIYADALKEAM